MLSADDAVAHRPARKWGLTVSLLCIVLFELFAPQVSRAFLSVSAGDAEHAENAVRTLAYAALFLRGRVKFCHPDGTPANTASAPSELVAYSERDFVRLRESGLRGAFLRVYEGDEGG